MKAFHISFHEGTINNVERAMLSIGHTVESVKSTLPYYISRDNADKLWIQNENYFKSFDVLIFTDTTMLSRPALQNLHRYDGLVIVYITNRFDWGIWSIKDDDYFNTLVEASKNKRVRFCSDNRYDQYYASTFGIRFTFPDIVRLVTEIPDTFTMPQNSKLFVYDKGSPYDIYVKYLNDNNIEHEVFSREKNKPFRDQQQISEFVGLFHLPYQANIQSLYENLGYSIIYIIPSKQFIKRLINECKWYYWEENEKTPEMVEKSVDFSEWYQPENEHLFIYFNDWNEINDKLANTDILKKKMEIRQHMIRNNNYYLNRWRELTHVNY